ncbi:hypothetical protein ACSRUE_31720 [Sorangium sp. KYC3313]|uniref:hypothetical protein n=1 Tax=Sorangium sp. KYC3313 TaxID=3449740 RepID=UPI003F8B8A97
MVELDTGKRRDHLPEEAREGVGFCWVDMRFEPSAAMLVVEGCIWACPYELRFFDFADPISGWPEIEAPVTIDADRRPPKVGGGGTIVCYRSAPDGAAGGDEAEAPIVAILTFRRDGLKLVLERVDLGGGAGEAQGPGGRTEAMSAGRRFLSYSLARRPPLPSSSVRHRTSCPIGSRSTACRR